MCKRRVNNRALVGIIAVLMALLVTEARAATCTTSKTLTSQTCCSWRTTSSGVKYCSLWCTGSEICNNTITGLSGSIVNGCTPGVNCPITQCSAYGTVDAGLGGTCNSSLAILDPNCGIKGLAVCTNPANQFNAQGTPYTLAGIEGITGDVKTCDKKGKCTNSLKLEPADTSAVCVNPNWNFLTFTASEFKAKSCFCPGGLDSNGKCCATSDRTAGVCSSLYGAGTLTEGTPTCMTALCSVDLSTYDVFNNFSLPYDCHPDTALTCGGITGTPCP